MSERCLNAANRWALLQHRAEVVQSTSKGGSLATRREFVASTVAVGVTAAAGLAAVKGTARSASVAPRNGGMEIVITLHIANGELKQRCDEFTKQAMIERKAAYRDHDAERWRRSPFGALAATSAHESDPDHVTIVLRDPLDDVVEWQCAHPFVVTVDKDPGLTTIDGTPSNPFGWTLPQSSQPVADYHSVRAVPLKKSGAAIQKFYKFTAWCDGLKLDPDIFCGNGI